jgi:hypothetical protein
MKALSTALISGGKKICSKQKYFWGYERETENYVCLFFKN